MTPLRGSPHVSKLLHPDSLFEFTHCHSNWRSSRSEHTYTVCDLLISVNPAQHQHGLSKMQSCCIENELIAVRVEGGVVPESVPEGYCAYYAHSLTCVGDSASPYLEVAL